MGTILESLHKFHIQTAVDDLHEKGGNQNVADHPLDGIYRCKICGWVYEGEELPEDLICPLCKHPASDFEPIQ